MKGFSLLKQRVARPGVILVPFRLEVGTDWPPDFRPFIPIETQPAERLQDRFQSLIHVAGPVGIVDPQHKLTIVMPGKQPVEQCCTHSPNVHITGGTGSKTGADRFRHLSSLSEQFRTTAQPLVFMRQFSCGIFFVRYFDVSLLMSTF